VATSPPEFIKEISDVYIFEGMEHTLVLPRIYDPDPYDVISVSLQMADPADPFPDFIYLPNQRKIEFRPHTTEGEQDEEYALELVLSDGTYNVPY